MPSHSEMGPIEQLIHCTARMEAYKAGVLISFGSSFMFQFMIDGVSYPCLITNKHVVKGADRVDFAVTLSDDISGPVLGKHRRISVSPIAIRLVAHPDPDVDLVAILIAPDLQKFKDDEGVEPYLVSLTEEHLISDSFLSSVSPVEEVLMIGYPNGLWDDLNNLPIVRRGITATNLGVKHQGKPEFLIDAACFPGSSGSPVFIANLGGYTDRKGNTILGTSRVALIGILYGGPQHNVDGDIVVVNVPTDTKSIAHSRIPNNLGYVVRADELLELKAVLSAGVLKPRRLGRNDLCPCGNGKKYKECHGRIY